MSRCLLLLLLAVLPALGACGEDVSTQVVPVAQPLPEREEARYRLLDGKGEQIGTARMTIARESDGLRLGIDYDFGPDKRDAGSVLVQRETMRPRHAERTVIDGERRYVTRAEYNGDVTVTLDDGTRTRSRSAAVNEAAYDNLEALFLWRTMDHSVGTEVRYLNVVVDPRRGTISRALGTVEVKGREAVRLPSGPVQAWRVEFRSAGVVNTAWYRADGARALVRYQIARGPTLLLDS